MPSALLSSSTNSLCYKGFPCHVISTSPALAVVRSFGSTVGLYLLFQTRCLPFPLLLAPQNCISGQGRSHIFWGCFSPIFWGNSRVTPAFPLGPQFSSSVSSSKVESEYFGIPKEHVVGRAKQTATPLL